ncbi:MAG: hypothetical protein Q9222_004631 [Ikaeria aurantiellina]
METSIDPQLRDHAQSATQSYSSLPPSSYHPLNPIRLPPPQQHHAPQHPWPPQPDSHLYYSHSQRSGQHAPAIPQPDPAMHHDHVTHQGQPDQPPADSKRPRACEACRGLKVRCEPDPVKGTCRRCAKAGRHCVVTAPSRKRQKKTDSRVAELEKKIDALTASLHATKAQAVSESDDDSVDDKKPMPNDISQAQHISDYLAQEDRRMAETADMMPQPRPDHYSDQGRRFSHQSMPGSEKKRRMSHYPDEESEPPSQESQPSLFNVESPSQHSTRKMSGNTFMRPTIPNGALNSMPSTTPHSISPTHEYADVVDRKILDATLASELFEHYNKKMAPHMPLVIFPPDTPSGAIRKRRPILFLAILSVASGQEHLDLQRILAKEIMRTFADRIVFRGERSLELIQALQVLVLWYWPEENRDAQTYQLIHMAAVMAIDLGLGRRVRGSREPFHAIWKDHPRIKPFTQTSDALESRRAWLGCYLLCASAAMGFRRTNLIRWSSYMDDCLDTLNASSEALASDSVLVEWVRLQKLADDVGNQISVEESTNLGISDVKTQYALKAFERQMKEWEKQASKQVTSGKSGPRSTYSDDGSSTYAVLAPLTFNFHVANLYMHEFAMHLDQTLEFPSTTSQRDSKADKSATRPEVLTTAHVGALTTCLTSIHGMFDTFLRFTTEDVRTIPVFYFVRVAYATVLLIKLYFAASAPDSELGKVMPSDDLRVEEYLRNLREVLQAGAGSGKCQQARSFFLVHVMLQTWFERQRDGKGTVPEEISKNKRFEAQPVDVEKPAGKTEYKRMQLNGDTPTTRRPSMAQAAPSAGAESMDQSRLHVLGEVALGNSNSNPNPNSNSNSNGHGMNQGSDNWNTYPAAPIVPPASGYMSYDYGAAVASMETGGFHTDIHGFQPGLEQAIGMTFNEGNLSYMDDYALYNMMQMPNVFENIA